MAKRSAAGEIRPTAGDEADKDDECGPDPESTLAVVADEIGTRSDVAPRGDGSLDANIAGLPLPALLLPERDTDVPFPNAINEFASDTGDRVPSSLPVGWPLARLLATAAASATSA